MQGDSLVSKVPSSRKLEQGAKGLVGYFSIWQSFFFFQFAPFNQLLKQCSSLLN